MTAKIDTTVSAAPPVVVPLPKAPTPPAPPTAAALIEREKTAASLKAREDRWKSITEAGGIDAWVSAQLKSRGLASDHLDPSRMSDAQKGDYKNRKKQEAEERRKLRREAWDAYRATHVTHLGVGVHWHEGAGPDKFDVERRDERARANDLPDLKDASDLARALGLSIPRLRWLAYHRAVDTGTHYRRWSIPKRDGSLRTISAPKKTLKAAQRWTLRNVAEKLPVHGAAHGFLSARSIVTNAVVHAGAATIVKLDIKDFFPTVNFRRVKGLFRKAGLVESVATLLALTATEAPREVLTFRGKTVYVAAGERALPQGSPTSPAITNAICLRMDRRLSGLARTLGFRYTRYADDLTFSFHVTGKLAPGARPRAPVGALLRGARAVLRAEGFVIHPSKTRVLRAGERQKITGLIVNRAPDGVAPARVPRETVRALRAAIFNREKGRAAREGESLAQLRGMAAFVYMTDPARGRAFLDRIAALEARAAAAAE